MHSIGIIGAGQIGRAIATALARNDIAATIANSRTPESLADLVAELGPAITAGTRHEAAAKDIVIVAVNWSNCPLHCKACPHSKAASWSTQTIPSRLRCSSQWISAHDRRRRSLQTTFQVPAW